MKFFLKIYRSKYKYLTVSIVFMFLGVYFLLEDKTAYYQLAFFVSAVQYILYYLAPVIKIKLADWQKAESKK